MAASQASLNEIVATIIRGAPGDRELITMALRALREHNWASGFAFEGARAPYDHLAPAAYRESAVLAVRVIKAKKDVDAARARAMACTYEHVLPPDAAALTRQLKADAPALVYVITHAAFGAAKIGVSDAPGSRIAEHRRAGWQLIAAFHVAAYAACAIEDDVLRWWRHNLRLPPYLKREQMPQGGWTETVAAAAVDLAATVAHVCELALSPDARLAG